VPYPTALAHQLYLLAPPEPAVLSCPGYAPLVVDEAPWDAQLERVADTPHHAAVAVLYRRPTAYAKVSWMPSASRDRLRVKVHHAVKAKGKIQFSSPRA